MKILQINTIYPNGSTGKIAAEIKKLCDENGIECKIACRYQSKNQRTKDTYAVSSYLDCHIHNRLAKINMKQGKYSKIKTLLFLRKIKKYNPDIIHLHNIHGSFINHKLLFNFIKNNHIKVVWTLHDCWCMTGGCTYFDMVGCEKWKIQCEKCPQKGKAYIDASAKMQKNKKNWFSGIEEMMITTPSNWLAQLVKESFMQVYPVRVINNGIDLSIFKPIESDFRETYNVTDKKIVLGVAFGWGERKGLDVFIEMAKKLPSDYQIVLVGTNEMLDTQLPENIISIHRTNNQSELAKIYSAVDVFANPTREENFPTVNIESLACGTPIVTFKTGGSPEIIDDNCGIVVEKNDVDAMIEKVKFVCEEKPFLKENCVKRASLFNSEEKFKEYIELYKSLMGR